MGTRWEQAKGQPPQCPGRGGGFNERQTAADLKDGDFRPDHSRWHVFFRSACEASYNYRRILA